jgi:hypothetical protein
MYLINVSPSKQLLYLNFLSPTPDTWQGSAYEAEKGRQEQRLTTMMQEAVRAATKDLRQPIVSEGELNGLLAAQIKV